MPTVCTSVDVVIPLSSNMAPDRLQALQAVLQRVLAFKPSSIVLMECSPDGNPHVDCPGHTVHVVKSSWNKPVAVNEAVKNHTSADWIFVLDADVLVDFDEARKLFEQRSPSEQVFRPCTKIYRLPPAQTESFYRDGILPKKVADLEGVSLFCGGAFLIQRDLYMSLRGFDERFDVYMEDTDLKRRILQVKAPVRIAPGNGYHLYHAPVLRRSTVYSALCNSRRLMSASQVRRDTVSRIGETVKVEQRPDPRGKVDFIIPYTGTGPIRARIVKSLLGSLESWKPGAIYFCGPHLPDGLPPFVTPITAPTLADAVFAALTRSTAQWVVIQRPSVKLAAGSREYLESMKTSFSVVQLARKLLVLSPAAGGRVLAGATSVKKMDGTPRTSDKAAAIAAPRANFLRAVVPETADENTLVDVFCTNLLEQQMLSSVAFDKPAMDFSRVVASEKVVRRLAVSGPVRPIKAVARTGTYVRATTNPGVPARNSSGDSPDIAVAIQCHTPYLTRVSACMKAVAAQTYAPAERFLVLDGCEPPKDADLEGWTVIRRKDGSPNPGRNAALEATHCDWIWYIDADDIPDPGYLAGAVSRTGDSRVGIVHADLTYSGGTVKKTPEGTDYWGLRVSNYVSTESVWRVQALKESGGWQCGRKWDDWTCALRVTALGWQTSRNPVPIKVTEHRGKPHRNVPGPQEFDHRWGRSYCVVALLAGREDIFPDWSASVLKMEYPVRTNFVIVDNSKRPAFSEKVQTLCAALVRKGHIVQYLKDDAVPDSPDRYGRHRVVAHLYNKACSRITEDVTVFWEDDNIPAGPGALKELVANWDIQRIGGICAVYESRNGIGKACGTYNHDFWGVMPPLSEMKGKVSTGLGFIPGGFACYQTAFVLQAMPFHVDKPDGKADGWDGKLSRAVRAGGKLLALDGTIECEHRFRGTV